MSIISDALKKVEGNSAASPTGSPEVPPAIGVSTERPQAGLVPRSSPPLFSVWSIVLSTIMVLIATALLLLTWHTNRARPPVVAEEYPVVIAETPAVTTAPPAVAAAPPAVTTAPPAVAEAPAPAAVPEPVPAALPTPVPPAPLLPVPPVPAPVAMAPTAPSVEATAAQTAAETRDAMELTGVVFTPQVRVAHINGKILSEGGEIAGYRIVRISRESVRLSKDGQYYVLQLKR